MKMYLDSAYHPTWGDRSDGRKLRTLDPMAVYGAQGDAGAVRSIGRTLAGQLASVGFNVDFAPVADVVTNPNNTEIGDRSFSDDPAVAAKMVAAMVRGLQESGTISCLKHFLIVGNSLLQPFIFSVFFYNRR